MLSKYYKLGFKKLNGIIRVSYYKIGEVTPCRSEYVQYEAARKIQNDNIGLLEVVEEE